ncbi:hypothetical protein [Halococcus sp. IIIV-5B]|uniref:hypothetical protein n=1 Tax=Halococcus sp. IIIV-5B TaxID=2321230 RepID=UPI000E740449|nr:hypothetical protein [Halococcus sp. IIIV-5B]RJT04134.1 hypothetical protein D3261_10215 [Halococcus sp. IIIV-5B]
MSDEYVVEVKSSARRASRTAGEWVHEHGRRRTFESEALAREWAHTDADGRVWVQNAAPHDASSVDGYLVAGRRPTRTRATSTQSIIGG